MFELQIDTNSKRGVIRLNDEQGCILRICNIPKELILGKDFIDITYPNKL